MKKLLYITLMMVLAGTLSCHRTSDVEARLIAIDSIIADAPDSALSLLDAIDSSGESPGTKGLTPASRMTQSERAYHALLTAQALYKAYIPATSDSLINLAWDYYKDHGPYDRRIRAMLYKGTTAEELGQLEEAMRWYKRTELESRPDDHYHRGYALMNMGRLYQCNYECRFAIDKYREAIIENKNDIRSYEFCCQQLSQLYQDNDIEADSSQYYIDITKQVAAEINDSLLLAVALSTQASKLFYDSCYEQSKNLAISIINTYGGELTPYNNWHYISQSYAKLGMVDSAYYYFMQSPAPVSTPDSSFYYHSLSLILSLKGAWESAHKYEVKSDQLAEITLLGMTTPSLKTFENDVEKIYLMRDAAQDKWKSNLLLITLAVILVIIVLTVAFFYLYNIRKNELELRKQVKWLNANYNNHLNELQTIKKQIYKSDSELSKAQEQIRQKEQEIKELRNPQPSDSEFVSQLYAQLSSTFDQIIRPLGALASDYFEVGNNATIFMKRFHNHFNTLWKDQCMWQQIENYINKNHNNCIVKLLQKHANLTDDELHILMLIILGFNSTAISICLGYKSLNVVYVSKSRLKRKLQVSCSIEDYLNQLENQNIN